MIGFCMAFVSTGAQAAPIVNTAGDGIEDYKNVDDTWGAAYSYYQNSGELVGSVLYGNLESNLYTDDTKAIEVNLTNYVEDELGLSNLMLTAATSEIEFWGWNKHSNSLDSLGSSTDGKVDNLDTYTSGTWALTPSTDVMSFYSVKAGNYFAMYYLSPAQNTGSWSTYDTWLQRIEDKPGNSTEIEISHYIGFNSAATPVPEPATMILFGTGLTGLLTSRFRKKQN